jgi:hypothetical protein
VTTHDDQQDSDDPREIYLRYNRAENDRDLDVLEELIDESLSVRVNGRPSLSSLEDDRRALASLYATYPDYRRELVELLAFEDRVVAQWRMWGTSEGPGVALLDVAGCSIVKVRDGRLAEADLYYNGEALNRIMMPSNGAAS